jgi:hypothetical protein
MISSGVPWLAVVPVPDRLDETCFSEVRTRPPHAILDQPGAAVGDHFAHLVFRELELFPDPKDDFSGAPRFAVGENLENR